MGMHRHMPETTDVIILGPTDTPPSIERVLTRQLNHWGLGHTWGYLVEEHPQARSVALQMSSYLTDFVPDPLCGRPLIGSCLIRALAEWEYGTGQTADPAFRFAFFVRGLIADLPLCLRSTVCVEQDISGMSIWDPCWEGLSTWWARSRQRPRLHRRYTPGRMGHILPIDYRMLVLVRHLALTREALYPLWDRMDFVIGR